MRKQKIIKAVPNTVQDILYTPSTDNKHKKFILQRERILYGLEFNGNFGQKDFTRTAPQIMKNLISWMDIPCQENCFIKKQLLFIGLANRFKYSLKYYLAA